MNSLQYQLIEAESLRKSDLVLIPAGDFIPADGEILEGSASVDESAITGESAPVIRESGGDFSRLQVVQKFYLIALLYALHPIPEKLSLTG